MGDQSKAKGTTGKTLEKLPDRFSGSVLEDEGVAGEAYLVELARLHEFCKYLKEELPDGFDYLSSVSAVDYPDRDPRFDIVYHLVSTKRRAVLQLKTRVAEGERVPSVVDLWKSALWNERETYDLMGIVFEGHPDLRRILLPESWHGHPLRKDYVMQDPEEDLWVDEKDLR